MNKTQKKIVLSIMGFKPVYILQALDADYADSNEIGFKEMYGVSFEEAGSAFQALIDSLKKDD